MTRKALGRGLSALLRTVETTTVGLEQVTLDRIEPNPFQPRRAFPEETLKELAASIRASGVVQPVLLRRSQRGDKGQGEGEGSRYQLVAGERRWRAARLAGLETIPAVIRDLTDRDALELTLTENILREDLNPLEVAEGCQALQEKHGLSHEEIAERLGVNRSTVTNTLRLLRLPPVVQQMIRDREISFGHARALVGLESVVAQIRLAKIIAQQGLSVRKVETMVALRDLRARKQKAADAAQKLDPNIRAAIVELERTLGTRVRILGNGKRGKIQISFFSADDLSRIFDWIVRR